MFHEHVVYKLFGLAYERTHLEMPWVVGSITLKLVYLAAFHAQTIEEI